MRIQRLLATAGLVLALSGPAAAGTLSTGYLYQGGNDTQQVCIAVNVGTKPIEVTVEAVPLDLTPSAGGSLTCMLDPVGATVNSNTGTCEVPLFGAGLCRFTAAGSPKKVAKSVRGVLLHRTYATLPPTIHTVLEAR